MVIKDEAIEILENTTEFVKEIEIYIKEKQEE